jgi:hypothetical protein
MAHPPHGKVLVLPVRLATRACAASPSTPSCCRSSARCTPPRTGRTPSPPCAREVVGRRPSQTPRGHRHQTRGPLLDGRHASACASRSSRHGPDLDGHTQRRPAQNPTARRQRRSFVSGTRALSFSFGSAELRDVPPADVPRMDVPQAEPARPRIASSRARARELLSEPGGARYREQLDALRTESSASRHESPEAIR